MKPKDPLVIVIELNLPLSRKNQLSASGADDSGAGSDIDFGFEGRGKLTPPNPVDGALSAAEMTRVFLPSQGAHSNVNGKNGPTRLSRAGRDQ
jgi:hypothetical protein